MQDEYQRLKGVAVREEGDSFKIQNTSSQSQTDGRTDRQGPHGRYFTTDKAIVRTQA